MLVLASFEVNTTKAPEYPSASAVLFLSHTNDFYLQKFYCTLVLMISFVKVISTVHNLFNSAAPNMEDMITYAARLASFEKTHATGKKRGSNTKVQKIAKWAHKTPTPAQVSLYACNSPLATHK